MIYIDALIVLSFFLYADDTTVFYSSPNIQSLFDKLNHNLKHVSQFFHSNKLSLNYKKCSFILFRSPQKDRFIDITPFNIIIDNHVIPNVESTKFLGIHIDSGLTWKSHIKEIENKVSKSLGVIFRLSSFIPPKILRILYCSLILPYLSYCNIVWANTYPSNLHKLHIIQKKAIRTISGAPPRSHSSPLFSNLNLLNIFDINVLQQCIFVYSSINFLLPRHICNSFIPNSFCHPYFTRNRSDIHIPTHRTNYFQFNIRFSGSKLWNNLPSPIVTSISKRTFSIKLKKHLIAKY